MNNLTIFIAAVLSTVLTSPAAFATTSISADVASDYFDANWAVTNAGSLPYQPASRPFEDIYTRYFDANWAAISTDSQPAEQPAEDVDDANTH